MRITTEAEYRAARLELDAKNDAIRLAPASRKPVFRGIAELHRAVNAYERQHKIVNQ